MKMKFYLVFVCSLMLTVVSCEKNKGGMPKEEEEIEIEKEIDNDEEVDNNEALEPVAFAIEGNDNMKFDQTSFTVKVGQEVKVTLKNVSQLPKEMMGHNFVVLSQGTDLTEFADEAFKDKANDYIPATYASSIIAHTKLLGSGESDIITFTIPKAGEYKFVCSFPGHWGTMQGKIIVE